MCRSGSHSVLANAATLGGHVTVGDWAWIGASTRRASVLPRGPARDHRRIQRDHPGRAAVFEHRERARDRRCSAPTRSAWSGAASYRRDRRSSQKAFRLLTRSGLNTTQAMERIRRRFAACAEVDELLGVHSRVRARVVKVMKYGLIAGNGRFPVLALESARRLGMKWSSSRSRKRRSPEIESLASRCHWISLGAAGQADRNLQAGRHPRGDDGRAGEARQDIFLDPAGLAAGQAAGVA